MTVFTFLYKIMGDSQKQNIFLFVMSINFALSPWYHNSVITKWP